MKYYFGILSVLTLVLSVFGEDELGVVKIVPDAEQRYVRIGDSFDAVCYVTTTSDDKLPTWKTPSKMGLITSNLETQTLKDGKVKLGVKIDIKSIQADHLGSYDCTFEASSDKFELLTPAEDKKSPNFTRGDDNATLTCDLSDPAASHKIEKVVWLKNDTLVTKLSDPDRFMENTAGHSLVIKNPKREDADLYIARFSFKDTSSTYDCHVPYLATPLVLPFDKSKNLIEDDTMELRCKVMGYPRAEIVWLKDDKELDMADNDRMEQATINGYTNALLKIKSVTFDDAGDYTCRAVSKYFNDSSSQTLVVRVKDRLAALWPFLGIVCEVVVLCAIIFVYEKRRNKQAESEANNAQDVDSSSLKKEGMRHRGQKK